MSYKKKTSHFGIPVVGKGDRIMPDIEMRRYTIIENMLIAGTQGLTEVVFDDGSYSLDKDGDQFEVSVRAGGTYPSIHGIVGGFYFKGKPKLKWDGLKNNHKYFLYVKATPNTPHDNSSIRLIKSTVRLGKGALLVATVNLRDEIQKVDQYPDGKVYSQDVARHASDTSNPHGVSLEQDEILISKKMEIAEEAEIEIAGKKIDVDSFVISAASLTGKKAEVINFESGGAEGVTLKASGKVKSVQVHRRVVGSFSGEIGETGIGYFGEDDSADEESEFVVYNTGTEGIPMRALIICG